MKLLEGKVAIITGASRGIGSGIAKVFAEQGANVAFTYSSSVESAMALESELNALGIKAKGYKSNAADFNEAQKLVDDVIAEFGTIDVLINNAGITKDNLMLRMKTEDFKKVIDVNLVGTFNMTKAASAVMMKKRVGRIINISSVVGLRGNAGQVNYASSKAGVIGLTKSVAKELAKRNITCNAIAPGFIETDMTGALSDKVKENILSDIPLGTLGQVEDIANLAYFLASDESKYITGQVIAVDGGMSM